MAANDPPDLHKRALRRCLPRLVQDLMVDAVLDYIISEEILHDLVIRDIKETPKTNEKIRLLVEKLSQLERSAYDKFLNCLSNSKQSHLRAALEKEEEMLIKKETEKEEENMDMNGGEDLNKVSRQISDLQLSDKQAERELGHDDGQSKRSSSPVVHREEGRQSIGTAEQLHQRSDEMRKQSETCTQQQNNARFQPQDQPAEGTGVAPLEPARERTGEEQTELYRETPGKDQTELPEEQAGMCKTELPDKTIQKDETKLPELTGKIQTEQPGKATPKDQAEQPGELTRQDQAEKLRQVEEAGLSVSELLKAKSTLTQEIGQGAKTKQTAVVAPVYSSSLAPDSDGKLNNVTDATRAVLRGITAVQCSSMGDEKKTEEDGVPVVPCQPSPQAGVSTGTVPQTDQHDPPDQGAAVGLDEPNTTRTGTPYQCTDQQQPVSEAGNDSWALSSYETGEDGSLTLKEHFDACVIYAVNDVAQAWEFKSYMNGLDLGSGRCPKVCLYDDEVFQTKPTSLVDLIDTHCTLVFVLISHNEKEDDATMIQNNVLMKSLGARVRPVLLQKADKRLIPSYMADSRTIDWWRKDEPHFRSNMVKSFQARSSSRSLRESKGVKTQLL